MPTQPDMTEMVPVHATDTYFKDSKGQSEHIDDIAQLAQPIADIQDARPATGLRRLLRRDPPREFLQDVVALNQEDLDQAEVKRVERKISMLIVPTLLICYIFYYVDKTTLSYAAVFTMKKDLHLSNSEYSWLGSLFYFGWLAWAIPTNLLMAKFPLAKYLAVNIFLWGVFLMAQGGAKNFVDLAVLRVISGAFEATADPAFVLITGTWFTRKQQPTVIGYWYLGNGIGIALGGLLGFGIGHIHSHLASWRWEFILIGLACSLWAIIMFIFIPDAPYGTRWLSRREAAVVVSRKRNDSSTVEKRQLKWDQVYEAVLDPKIYLFFGLGFFANVPNGVTSNYGTIIVKGLGFNTLQTTLLQIPYGTFIAIMILIAIYTNHKTHHLGIRTYLMAGITVLTVVGFAMMRWAPGKAAPLIGYYLTGSSNAVFVLGLSLVSGNVGGVTKKALASGAIFLGVSVGNIVGPFTMTTAPYNAGVTVCMCSRALEIGVVLMMRVLFVRANRKRDRRFEEGDDSYAPNAMTFEDITDGQNKHFRYISESKRKKKWMIGS